MSEAKPTKAAAKAATTKAAPVAKPAEAAQVDQKPAETAQTTDAADAPVAIVDGEQQKADAAQADQAKEAMEVVAEQAASQKEPLPPGDDGSVKPQAVPADPVEPLTDFIARVERAKLDQDVVAVAITHPEVHADRVHPGTYGGIRLSAGAPAVTYSDGTQI